MSRSAPGRSGARFSRAARTKTSPSISSTRTFTSTGRNSTRTRKGDFPDNAERFTFFSRAVLELCRALDFAPDIIHTNDWQTGLASFFLKTVYRGTPPFERHGSVFTIHNLGYQGNFWHWDMRYIGDAWQHFTPEGLRVLGQDQLPQGRAGLLRHHHHGQQDLQPRDPDAGIRARARRRAREALVRPLRDRERHRYEEWDPATDDAIAEEIFPARPAGKADCKSALQKKIKLPVTPARRSSAW